MKRRMLSVAVLLLLPAIGSAADAKVIKTRNLDQLITELADWSQPLAEPGEYRVVHKVTFCQTRARSVPRSQAPSCRPMLYAMSTQSLPGYIQADATPDSDVPQSSGDWYRVSPEWHSSLWRQFRHHSSWLEEYLIFWSADADKQIEEVADWSRKVDSPKSHRKPQRILFCQARLDETNTSSAATESCYIVLLKRGGLWTPGYVRFADVHGAVNKGTSVTWFQLTPEWDKTLKARINSAEMERSMFQPGEAYVSPPSNMPAQDDREYLNTCPTCRPGAK